MSNRFEFRSDLASKIEWEGGIFEALDYGIKAEDMPEGDTELTAAWTELRAAYDRAAKLAEKVEALLEDDEDDGDES